MATATNKKDGILGNIVTWRVPETVSFDTLKRGLVDAGLDPDLVKELAPYNALTRALNEMKKGRVIRKLRREDRKIFFQITKEFLSDVEAVYEKETDLAIDADSGVLFCDNIAIKEQAQKLINAHMQKRLASDVASLMFRIYKKYDGDLISIREQGGAYFVPDSHTGLVDQSRKLFNTIGGKLRTFEVRLGAADTAQSVAESMSEYFEGLVTQFKDSCKDVDLSRSNVSEARIGKIADLRRKLELYRGLLQGYSSHIADVIDDANQDLMRQMAKAKV